MVTKFYSQWITKSFLILICMKSGILIGMETKNVSNEKYELEYNGEFKIKGSESLYPIYVYRHKPQKSGLLRLPELSINFPTPVEEMSWDENNQHIFHVKFVDGTVYTTDVEE
jgi:hypothetical protein